MSILRVRGEDGQMHEVLALKGEKGEKGPIGATGPTGESGKSAYQSYLDNGGTLTEVQWLASLAQGAPEYAASTAECTDTSKMYVLPDGYIYAYTETTVETDPVPGYTDQMPISVGIDGNPYNNGLGYKPGYRISSSGAEKASSTDYITGYVPVNEGDVIRLKNYGRSSNGYEGVSFYDSGKGFIYNAYFQADGTLLSLDQTMGSVSNGILMFNVAAGNDVSYIRVTSTPNSDPRVIITKNEEIVMIPGGAETVTTWVNTGIAYTPADYEERIVALENNSASTDVIDNPELVSILEWTQGNIETYIPILGAENHNNEKRVFSSFFNMSIVQGVVTITPNENYLVRAFYYDSEKTPKGNTAFNSSTFTISNEYPYWRFVVQKIVDGNEQAVSVQEILSGAICITALSVKASAYLSSVNEQAIKRLNVFNGFDYRWTKNFYVAPVPNEYCESMIKGSYVDTDNGRNFINITTLQSNLSALATSHPNYVTEIVLPEKDASNTYDMKYYVLDAPSRFDSEASPRGQLRHYDKPVFIVSAGLHGFEVEGVHSAYHMMKDLCENHKDSELIGWLHNNVTFVFLPIANPWGYANLSHNNYNGVDLNRNFEYGFGVADSSYGDGALDGGDCYKGTEPYTEPETRNMKALFDSYPNAMFHLELHDQGQCANWKQTSWYSLMGSLRADIIEIATENNIMATEKRLYNWGYVDADEQCGYYTYSALDGKPKDYTAKANNTLGGTLEVAVKIYSESNYSAKCQQLNCEMLENFILNIFRGFNSAVEAYSGWHHLGYVDEEY